MIDTSLKIFAASRNDAASYYRIDAPFRTLAMKGWDVEVGHPVIEDAGSYDVLWLQMHASAESELLVRAYQSEGAMVVYDVDDWLFDLPPSWSCYTHYYRRGSGEPTDRLRYHERLIQLADVVTVPTAYLGSLISSRFPGTLIKVVPNRILAGDWDTLGKMKPDRGPILGWFGTSNHWDNWRQIAPIVDEVLEEVDGHLALVGAPELVACLPKRLANRTMIHPLVRITEFHNTRLLIRAFNVGLAWISDDLVVGRAKSPLKALQYGAAGVPFVASETVYGQLPDAGKYFQTTNLIMLGDNLRSLLMRHNQPEVAGRVGEWRHRVFNQYSIETNLENWESVLEQKQ
jgi:glycosyltransferase involved in cell wall biosynthesis